MVDKDKRILVTGATGFVGSYICRALLNEGYTNVHALKRTNSSLELLGTDASRISWHECDVLDMLGIDEIVSAGYAAIIHAAAIVSFAPKDDDDMIEANMKGTRYLVDSALKYGVQRFIHISSVSALGKSKSGNIIDEEAEWQDSKYNSPYSISKKAAEMEVWRGHAEGLSVGILNPSIVLGAGNWTKSSVKIFGNMIRGQKLYPPGSNGFVDVRDVARASVLLLSNGIHGKRFVLNGANLSFKSLMEKIADVYQVTPPKYKIRQWMIPISWRLMGLYALLSRRVTVYNKYSVISSSKHWKYDNAQSVKELGISYRNMDDTIQSTADAFLRSREEELDFALLPFD